MNTISRRYVISFILAAVVGLGPNSFAGEHPVTRPESTKGFAGDSEPSNKLRYCHQVLSAHRGIHVDSGNLIAQTAVASYLADQQSADYQKLDDELRMYDSLSDEILEQQANLGQLSAQRNRGEKHHLQYHLLKILKEINMVKFWIL